MRVNIYAEEMTNRVELVEKDGFTGIRFYLYLPVTLPNGHQASGPFMHRKDDDDSSAVTFWGKRDLKECLETALKLLEESRG
jgi:hypothetical protein